MIEIMRLSGRDIGPYLESVAKLRTEVFREFPYLYAGSEEDEAEYLENYSRSRESVVLVALRDGNVVGVSTGLPLAEADAAFRKPFLDAGIDCRTVFYFGESVLRATERGHGIGNRFFDEREAHARDLGYRVTAFCSVFREPDHPLQPPGYRPNDEWWKRRGYQARPDLVAEMEWQQVDRAEKAANRLIFWMRARG